MNEGTIDLVAGADAERAQREHQRVGAVGHAGGVARAEVGGELALEGGDLRAEDERAAVDAPRRSSRRSAGAAARAASSCRTAGRASSERRSGVPQVLARDVVGANMRMPHILVAAYRGDARHRGPCRRGARLGSRRLRARSTPASRRSPTAASAPRTSSSSTPPTPSTSARPPTARAPAAPPSTNGCDTGSLPLGTPRRGRRRQQARHARLQLVAGHAGSRRDRCRHLRLQRPRTGQARPGRLREGQPVDPVLGRPDRHHRHRRPGRQGALLRQLLAAPGHHAAQPEGGPQPRPDRRRLEPRGLHRLARASPATRAARSSTATARRSAC